MKHLHKFEDRNTIYRLLNSLEEPTVVKLTNTGEIIYSLDNLLDNPEFKDQEYLTIHALSAGSLNIRVNGTIASGQYMAYSINNEEWITVTSTKYGISLNQGDKVRFKGNRTSYCPSGSSNTFYFSNYFIVYGDISSLTEDPLFGGPSSGPYQTRQFAYLFSGNPYLLSIKNLKIPNSTGQYSLFHMFSNCSRLLKAMDGEIQINSSYAAYYMFYSCTSLKTASNLTLNVYAGSYGCSYMFGSCTALKEVPIINEKQTAVASNMYNSMFRKCNSIEHIPEYYLPGLIKGSSAYAYMFRECTSLLEAPRIIGNVNYDYLCDYMFYGCTGLNELPNDYFSDVTTTTLDAYATFRCMFYGCTNLYAQFLQLPIIAEIGNVCYNSMFSNCEQLRKILIYSIFEKDSLGDNMCSGCTRLSEIDSLTLYHDNNSITYTNVPSVYNLYLFAQGTNISLSIADNQYPTIYTLQNTTFSSDNLANCNVRDTFAVVAPPVQENITFSTDAQTLWEYCSTHPSWLYNSTDKVFGYISNARSTTGYDVYDIRIGNDTLRVAKDRSNNTYLIYKNTEGFNITEQKAQGQELLQSWLSKTIYSFDPQDYISCFTDNNWI